MNTITLDDIAAALDAAGIEHEVHGKTIQVTDMGGTPWLVAPTEHDGDGDSDAATGIDVAQYGRGRDQEVTAQDWYPSVPALVAGLCSDLDLF